MVRFLALLVILGHGSSQSSVLMESHNMDLGKRKGRRQIFAAQAWLLSTFSELLPGWLVRWQEGKGILNQKHNQRLPH